MENTGKNLTGTQHYYFESDYSELLFIKVSQTKYMWLAKTLHSGLTLIPGFYFDSSILTRLMSRNTQVQV